MLIDRKTKTKRILPLVDEKRLDILLSQCPPVPLDKPILQMTVSEFEDALTDKGYALRFLKEKYAFDAFGKMRTFKEELAKVVKYINSMELQPSEDERAAATGIEFPDLCDRMRIDLVKFFHLHSFEEAEKMPVTSWILVEQNKTSGEKYQRRFSEIQRQKR